MNGKGTKELKKKIEKNFYLPLEDEKDIMVHKILDTKNVDDYKPNNKYMRMKIKLPHQQNEKKLGKLMKRSWDKYSLL